MIASRSALLLAGLFLALTAHASPPPVEQLGEPVATVIIQGVAFGAGTDGTADIYFATNGSPATFYAVNAATMEVSFRQTLPGLDVVWAIDRGSDGRVYFAGTRNGRIYRFCPEAREIVDLGPNGSGDNWVWDIVAGPDGKLYGSTYPNARVFEIDPGAEKVSGWARDFTGEQYARGLGVTAEHVYVGVGTRAHLFRIDRTSAAIDEIPVPNRGNPGSSISRIWAVDGRLLVRAGGSRLFVWDIASETWIRGGREDHLVLDYALSPPSPVEQAVVYYKRGASLWRYDTVADRVEEIDLDRPLPPNPVRGWAWLDLPAADGDVRPHLVGLTEFGEVLRYDPRARSIEIVYPEVEPQGVIVQALESGPDGLLYLGGYQGGLAIYDPREDAVVRRYPQFNQPEGIGFLDGKIYFGTYSSARIFRLDPEGPGDFGHAPTDNPGPIFAVGHFQDRPFALASGEGKLFIGTVPGYGGLGGALTVYEPATGEWNVHPNLIENQSIIALAYRDGKLYGATSVFGGLGIAPTEEAAKLFVWDVAEGRLIRVWAPNIAAIDATPRALGGLSFGPDGKLWLAAGGTIAVLDAETFEVERSRLIHPSNWNISHYWRPVYLRWAEDGRLFTTLGRRLTVIWPDSLDSEVWDETSLMDLPGDGYVYYARGSHLLRRPLRASR